MKLPGALDMPQSQFKSQATGPQIAHPIVPAPASPQGGRRRWVQSLPCVFNSEVSEPGGWTKHAYAYMDIPSVRLHCKFAFGFQTTNGAIVSLPPPGATGWTLTLDAFDRDQDGRLLQTNNIVTNQPLPTSYESITANDRWRATIIVPDDPGNGANVTAPGVLIAIGMWEPAPGWNVNDEELARIFQACHITVDGLAVTSL